MPPLPRRSGRRPRGRRTRPWPRSPREAAPQADVSPAPRRRVAGAARRRHRGKPSPRPGRARRTVDVSPARCSRADRRHPGAVGSKPIDRDPRAGRRCRARPRAICRPAAGAAITPSISAISSPNCSSCSAPIPARHGEARGSTASRSPISAARRPIACRSPSSCRSALRGAFAFKPGPIPDPARDDRRRGHPTLLFDLLGGRRRRIARRGQAGRERRVLGLRPRPARAGRHARGHAAAGPLHRADQARQLRGSMVAVAAGSGITPVLSLIKTVLAREPGSRFFLLYGNRTSRDIIFAEELARLKDRYLDRFSVTHVLSREAQDVPALRRAARPGPDRRAAAGVGAGGGDRPRLSVRAAGDDGRGRRRPRRIGGAGASISCANRSCRARAAAMPPPPVPEADAPPEAVAAIVIDGRRHEIPIARRRLDHRRGPRRRARPAVFVPGRHVLHLPRAPGRRARPRWRSTIRCSNGRSTPVLS